MAIPDAEILAARFCYSCQNFRCEEVNCTVYVSVCTDVAVGKPWSETEREESDAAADRWSNN